ncbi:MAG TPA: MBL fold metallo-hydrolase [Gaiellaceae bacterium]|nr:MBL fold metallo-hydrolase [Gaiellaceae bacterium]
MIVERSMDPRWLSNAYLVADRVGGTAVFVDSGAPVEPLLAAVDRLEVHPTLLLTTHAHADHVENHGLLEERYGLRVLSSPDEEVEGAEPLGHGEVVAAGDLEIRALRTPGHTRGMLAFVADDEAVFTGDTLFTGSVGGTQDAFDDLRRSVMDVLMGLPHELVVYPGHSEETTIGREWDENPFVRVWRGVEPEGTERCHVGGAEATLVVWSNDYDGGGKAWVRFGDGRDAIVGGSRILRQ